jgi:hypothetical protein
MDAPEVWKAMSDEKADEDFLKHILGIVQIFAFAIACCVLAMVYYDQPTRREDMEKTKYEHVDVVETANVLPKTLQAETQMMPMQGAMIAMYAVYGRTDGDRKVWCATFVDSDEAMAWVQASRVFGRAVRGAVIADQKPKQETTDGAGEDSREPAERPN